MSHASPLQAAIEAGLLSGGHLGNALAELGEYGISTELDAKAVSRGLREWVKTAPKSGFDLILSLHLFNGLLQGVETREAYEILRREALPPLLQAFDIALEADPIEGTETLLFTLKVGGMFIVEGIVERIVAASRKNLGVESPLWPTIFSTFSDDHPYQLQLAKRLQNPPPSGMLGLAYLDFVVPLLASNRLTFHPFDSPLGREILNGWLSDTAATGPALVAAASLPFLEPEGRAPLLKLGRMHPNGAVRLKTHWAEARLGDDSAVRKLVEYCQSPGRAKTAIQALETLGKGNLVPAIARQPNFLAAAELCDWLSHPNEYGRPPDALDIIDTRSATWPPTADQRRLWLFRFRYDNNGVVKQGHGMTGSITFSLRAETENLDNPVDIYAIHCLWELQAGDDPRTPRSRSIEVGREILKESGWNMN